MKTNWTIEKCQCGHKACKDYHTPQLGMVQGGMVDFDTAQFIVRACNSHDDLVAALETVSNLVGFEPDEPYGMIVMNALAKAKGEV